ncbi:MAG: flagellar M-ring protein FliF, partial [Firmicutes bacterium]|nr:flagellar M-ring protein FliF [Bacillota bacterium]
SQAELADEAGVENHIKNNIETMLDQMLGPGAAVVRVHAALNFNHGNVAQTTYGKGQLSSQQTSSSSSSSQGTVTQAAGTGSNTPVYPSSSSTGPTKSSSHTTTSHWDVPVTHTTTVVAPGAIKQVTVAVVVDKKLSAAQDRSIRQLVQAAAGLPHTVPNQVVVVGMPFNHSAANAAVSAMKKAAAAKRLREEVLAGVAIVLAIVAGLLLRRRMRRKSLLLAEPALAGELPASPEIAPLSVSEMLKQLGADQTNQDDEQKKQVEQLMQENPDNMVRLIRVWMQGDHG